MLRRALSFFVATAAALWLWSAFAPAYNRVLCAVAQPLLHIDRRFAGAVLVPLDRIVRVTSSTALPMAHIPADLLTYNVILLTALFASDQRLKPRAYLISLGVLAVGHIFGLLISIESTYALRLGAWSEQHYSDFAGDLWLAAELFYRVVGMFGLAFACWWAASTRTAYRRTPPDRTE